MQEPDDNEAEMVALVQKQSEFKRHLRELDSRHECVSVERDTLIWLTTSYNMDHAAYEEALERCTHLTRMLSEAEEEISILKAFKQQHEQDHRRQIGRAHV